MPPPHMMGVQREALDMQRFAVERKRRVRDMVSALHKHLAKTESMSALDKMSAEDQLIADEAKHAGTEEFTSG